MHSTDLRANIGYPDPSFIEDVLSEVADLSPDVMLRTAELTLEQLLGVVRSICNPSDSIRSVALFLTIVGTFNRDKLCQLAPVWVPNDDEDRLPLGVAQPDVRNIPDAIDGHEY